MAASEQVGSEVVRRLSCRLQVTWDKTQLYSLIIHLTEDCELLGTLSRHCDVEFEVSNFKSVLMTTSRSDTIFLENCFSIITIYRRIVTEIFSCLLSHSTRPYVNHVRG